MNLTNLLNIVSKRLTNVLSFIFSFFNSFISLFFNSKLVDKVSTFKDNALLFSDIILIFSLFSFNLSSTLLRVEDNIFFKYLNKICKKQKFSFILYMR